MATLKTLFGLGRLPKWSAADHITEHGKGVFLVEGPASNWVIVGDASGYLLVDGGYPKDLDHVLASLRHLCLAPTSAKAMLITHGHSDHTGSAQFFSNTFGTPVYCSAAELEQLTGQVKYQVSLPVVLGRIRESKVGRWMVHAILAGGLKTNDVQNARIFDEETLRALPGAPVAVPLPGHTPGHTAYLFPEARAIATGDSLVTGHAISDHTGPQMLDSMFHHRTSEVLESLDVLAQVNASIVLPGHGPAVHGAMADLISAARG